MTFALFPSSKIFLLSVYCLMSRSKIHNLRNCLAFLFFMGTIFMSPALASGNAEVQLSQQFLSGLKDHQNVESLVLKIANLDPNKLSESLNTDHKKLAFWINIYNGFIQYQLKENPKRYEDRGAFFADKSLKIAG